MIWPNLNLSKKSYQPFRINILMVIHLLVGLGLQHVGMGSEGEGTVWWLRPAHLGGAKQVVDLHLLQFVGESHCFSWSTKKGHYHSKSWDRRKGTTFHFVLWENVLEMACYWWLEAHWKQVRSGPCVTFSHENIDSCFLSYFKEGF